MTKAPISVGIPTYGRGLRLATTLRRILGCDPAPAEILVHVDGGNEELKADILKAFPTVRVLSSAYNIGPGGGRHRCIVASTQPYFASFDDDSWPMDSD